MSLTDVGHAYFARSKRILEELEEANDEAADRQSTPRGTLRIAAPITFGSLFLGPIVARYMAEFPRVDISLHLQERLIARKLVDYWDMACASPKYLALAGIPGTPEDLRIHALIGYIGYVTIMPWTFVNSDGQATELRCHCRFMANNTAMMLEVALAGVGIASQTLRRRNTSTSKLGSSSKD